MKPVSPVIPGHADQPQYNPLPSIKQVDGVVITRWAMSWRERLRVLLSGSVYLEVSTFNQPLQPLRMSVDAPEVEPPPVFEPADAWEKSRPFG